MWAWYLEWSTIARAVIKDGRLLQRVPSAGVHEAAGGPGLPS